MPRSNAGAKHSRTLVLAVVAAVVAILYLAAEVLIPLAVAVLLSFLLAPLAARIERLKIGRIASVIVTVVLGFSAIGVVVWIGCRQAMELSARLPEYRSNIKEKLEGLTASLNALSRKMWIIREVTGNEPATQPATGETLAQRDAAAQSTTQPAKPLPVTVVPRPTSMMQFLRASVGTMLKPLGMAGIAVIFVIFMLLQREDLRDRLIRLMSHGDLNLTTQAITDAGRRISRYLLMQLLVNTCYGIVVAIGLYLIGVPNAVLWGLLATLCRFVPYIGPWIGAAAPIVLSFAIFPGYRHLVVTLGLYIGIELITSNGVEPWLYGTSTGMSELAVLVAAVFWTWLWGPIGLLLSTPLTVCLVVIGKYVPQLGFFDVLLGDEPVLSPGARVYQRLLAGDEEEAWDLLEEHLKEKDLLALCDEMLIPALRLIEQDHHRGQLDERRRDHLQQAIGELLAEAAEKLELPETRLLQLRSQGNGAKEASGANGACAICLPAGDEADELVASMLALVLQPLRCTARYLTTDALASEMVEAVARQHPRIVCISALPPSAVGHARYLCKRLRVRIPDIHIVVGLWTARPEMKNSQQRLSCADTDRVVTSLKEAVEHVRPLMQSLPPTPSSPLPRP